VRHREGAQRRRVEAEDQQVLLRVVRGHVERQGRAAPEVVRERLDARDDQDARVARASLRHARQKVLDAGVEHRPLLVDHARERAKRRQAILDAQEVVLGDEQRADALPLGHAGQVLERDIAGREIRMDVQNRGNRLQRGGRHRERRGEHGEERGRAFHLSPFSRASDA